MQGLLPFIMSLILPQIFEGCAQDLCEWLESICPTEGAQSQTHWDSPSRVTILTHLGNIIKFTAKYLKLPCMSLRMTSEECEEAVRSLSSTLLSCSLDSQNPILCEILAEVCFISFLSLIQSSRLSRN